MQKRILIAFLTSLILAAYAFPAVPGPIKVSPNGRYFVDREGKPFFWLGDTAWPLFANYSQSQAEAYLRNRAAKGFTVIQCALVWVLGTGNPEGGVPPSTEEPRPNVFGERPWRANNPATPNDAYFKHVDDLVSFANQQGLVLAVLPTWGYYINQTRILNTQNARAYGRWLGARYREAPNIIWINGGDRVPAGFGDVYRELARGLREGDGGAHLISYHPCGWHSSSQFFHREEWLDFNLIQTWTEWSKIYAAVSSDVALTPAKPVVLGEGAYENGPEYPQGPITPLIIRRQAWWAVTAGGFFTYGQDQMWRMAEGWDRTFDTPGAAQVARMKDILTARRWWEMVPDQGLFSSGVGSERTLNTALRSIRGDLAISYLSSQCRVFVNLDKILTKNVKTTWVNPVSGEKKDAGTYATGNLTDDMFPPAQIHYFETPGHWEDAVLVLEGF